MSYLCLKVLNFFLKEEMRKGWKRPQSRLAHGQVPLPGDPPWLHPTLRRPTEVPGTRWVWLVERTVDGDPEQARQSSKGMLNRETSAANGADAVMALSQPPSSFPQTLQEHRKPLACGLWLLAMPWRSAGRGQRPWHPPSPWAQSLQSARSHGTCYLMLVRMRGPVCSVSCTCAHADTQ